MASLNTGGSVWLAAVTASNSRNRAWSSVIQRSADAGTVETPTEGLDWSWLSESEAVLIGAGLDLDDWRRCQCAVRPPSPGSNGRWPICENLGQIWT